MGHVHGIGVFFSWHAMTVGAVKTHGHAMKAHGTTMAVVAMKVHGNAVKARERS